MYVETLCVASLHSIKKNIQNIVNQYFRYFLDKMEICTNI